MNRLLLSCLLSITVAIASVPDREQGSTNPPVYIAFLWHMHQPIYWPYETVIQTDQNARYSYSVQDIHNQRWGPYTSWPKNAVQTGVTAGFPHFGAQVSFSGSLIENLNTLEGAGNINFQNWKSHWNTIKTQSTSLGNPRLDMVAFGYHHPLMGLVEAIDIRKQVQAHRQIMAANFSGTYSRGIFPPENAFSPRMIPALVREGIEWVLVDNIHFDRAAEGYPFSTAGNLYEPNKADVRNPNPNDWVELNGLWAPTRNSARWGRQPHYVEHIDPVTGTVSRIIAVPTDRYLGNEDGRGGFGALNYEYVMSQLEAWNTDPNHPMLIVLHHDGDNYGGGSNAYYNSNFQNFVTWLQANSSRFVCTTVQDYLEMFPPSASDVIHIEDGSWSGADNGDPEFKKWNGDPAGGYSPDRNSWGIITAAKNYVATAEQVNPSSPNTQNAWKHFLNGEASDYWYWDGSQSGIWDSHPARAMNLALPFAQAAIAGGTDLTPPTIYLPQREPYNPGATEWNINQPSDFTVWTYAFDLSGLQSVTLKYRTDLDGVNSNATVHNETYAGGSDVTVWTPVSMTGVSIPSQTSPQPLFKANEFSAPVTGLNNVLVDYYVEAFDSAGNLARSPIMHVWVGVNGGGGTPGVSWAPPTPAIEDRITITVAGAAVGGKLHWGVNNSGSSWQTPHTAYWPAGSVLFNGTGPAVESPFTGPDSAGVLRITIGPFNTPSQAVDRIAFVIHYDDNSWNNNNGQDFHVTIAGAPHPPSFVMDGSIDSLAALASSNGALSLHLAWNGVQLYVATQSAQSQGGDMFVLVADSQRAQRGAPWAKSGTASAWGAFLGNESTNNWTGWFNSAGSQTTGNGVQTAATILEGALGIQATFGAIPSILYIAVGRYQTQDGGILTGQVPAGDGDGDLEGAEFFAFPIDSLLPAPAVPAPLSPADGATGQPLTLALRWEAAAGATSYGVQAGTDSTFSGGFVMHSTSITDTMTTVAGLRQGTRYFWRINARNLGGTSSWSPIRSFTTLLLVPSAVVLVDPTNGAGVPRDSVRLIWRTAEAAVTRYWLDTAGDSLFTAPATDTSITDTGCTLYALTVHSTTWWRVRGGNAAGWGPFSLARRFTALPGLVSIQVPVSRGWTMVSNPVTTSEDSVRELFPLSALSYAFSFAGTAGYQQSTRLLNGRGYWVKADSAGLSTIVGSERAEDSIAVEAGWNLIGSVSAPLAVDALTTVPPALLASDFFEYTGTQYEPVSTLLPGRAYWVKTQGAGVLILGSPGRTRLLPARR